ncbi:MAG: rhodanese-like domain-containing protein [Candidatus Bathyarchaeota archaeon]|nr:rhodanese-like domain-containing protein [Candidatus Bathyarchaeota archaeon]
MNNKFPIIALIILTLIVLGGWFYAIQPHLFLTSEIPTSEIFTTPTSTPTTNPAIIIGPERAYITIQENKMNQSFIIIDVRTPEEFEDGHIENAINIDIRSETFQDEINELDMNNSYLVYCAVGVRSGLATDIMEELGFQGVYDMKGGFIEWMAEGLPVVKSKTPQILDLELNNTELVMNTCDSYYQLLQKLAYEHCNPCRERLLDEVMEFFVEDSMLVKNSARYSGREEIRSLFSNTIRSDITIDGVLIEVEIMESQAYASYNVTITNRYDDQRLENINLKLSDGQWKITEVEILKGY